MECPKCGADNVEDAEFCSLCLERLGSPGPSTVPSHGAEWPVREDRYAAPGEWRGDPEALTPQVSKVVGKKVREFRIRLLVYAVIVAVVLVWIILSFTVWGNPSPGELSQQLLEALNRRDQSAFIALIVPESREAGAMLYNDGVKYLGEKGEYADIGFKVDEIDEYDAIAYVQSGSINGGSGGTVGLSPSSNLVIVMENHKGKWYVNPRGTWLLP